jgi:hypothetical protein
MSDHNNDQGGDGRDDYYYYDDHDGYDDNERQPHEEWVPLGNGIWLILHTHPDGTASVQQAERRPDGGTTVYF